MMVINRNMRERNSKVVTNSKISKTDSMMVTNGKMSKTDSMIVTNCMMSREPSAESQELANSMHKAALAQSNVLKGQQGGNAPPAGTPAHTDIARWTYELGESINEKPSGRNAPGREHKEAAPSPTLGTKGAAHERMYSRGQRNILYGKQKRMARLSTLLRP